MRTTIPAFLICGATLLLTTQCARTTEPENPTYTQSDAARRAVAMEAATPDLDTIGAAATAPDASLSAAATAPVPAAPDLNVTPADYRTAIRTADAGLKLHPRNFDLLLTRAKAQTKLGNYAEALPDYTAALRLKSDDANAYRGRGMAYAALQQYSAAISDYSKALKYNPNDKEAFFNRGKTRMQTLNFKAAISDFTQAIALDSTYAAAYEARGTSYSSLNQPTEARADLEKAATLAPHARR
ncbi:tetratricopeptide repeat protein [Hymenobacter profundi]|uniref:Tetratricopeptide repeat protein n=1 Tax=Hymenobacter profundi TaxID=1982110 RepID=A0ABS6X7F8_9BACT|nr:tetratricopeptide repeat protein [Hymenobacter profundi]MBW3130889.1 tetratricopeptide repeat protein [Hymenobacter profundi]